MPASPLNIIFAGSGEFGAPSLRALIDAGHRILHVYTQPDRPAGRGKKLTPTPIANLALERRLPFTPTAAINAEPLAPADLLVVIAFGQKIAPHVVDHPRLGGINLHASLLPKYRGAAPINWTILRGETVTGNSVIRLARKMDAGAILQQSRLAIGELETAGELHDRLAIDGAQLLVRVVEALSENGGIPGFIQDESLATLAPKLNRDAARIDWTRPASEIARRIRGLHPWPGCRVRLLDSQRNDVERLTLVRARHLPQTPALPPGTITPAGTITSGDGLLEILEVQPEGRRAMTLEAYRRGHNWGETMMLESI